MLQDKRLLFLFGLVGIPFFYAMIFMAPHPQDQAYHNFIDQRLILGIPNFHNVTSNIGFLITGILGIVYYFKNKTHYHPSWLVFFVAVTFIAPGSSYYHWSPDDQSLVWDRLPMTVAFTSLIASIFIDIYQIKKANRILIPLVVLGIYSLLHWVWFDDLRVYGWVQISTIFTMLYIAIAYKSPSIKMHYILTGMGFYVLAKILEHNETVVYANLNFSGHSLKHYLASLTILSLILMKQRSLK